MIEHLYYPRKLVSAAKTLLRGIFILSTPYHGYLKNLALALSGKLNAHFTVLWDHGHIKCGSVKTLSGLLEEQSFEVIDVARVGRFSYLAKSMIVAARLTS